MRLQRRCVPDAECHAKQDAKFDTAAMVALVEDLADEASAEEPATEDLADEASAEEPATFSSEENMDEMDQSSRRRRWGHRHHRHHKHHPHTHHTHVPHKHTPHAHTPHSHTVCQDGKTHGQEFIVYDAIGKYCYRAVIGQAVEQGSRDEAKCNKASFAKKILVGKGSGTSSAYTNGDSAHCDGPREATLTITASTAAKSSSATVTEPSKCKYAIHMTVPKTCTTTESNKVWYCAIHHSSGNRVLRKTWSLPTAQAALGVGSSSQQQAIIPMSGSLVNAGGLTSLGGDPHVLAKGWGTGSMWWGGWNQINSMRQKCAQESAPPAGTF